MTEYLRCSKCYETLPVTAFNKNPRIKRGYQNYCRRCANEYAAEWQRRKAIENPEAHKRRIKGNKLNAEYGISIEEYEAMKEAQDNKCAICEEEPEVLVVDHDHETGKVRGLLCHSCNRGLGLFGDDPERLRRAVKFLQYKKIMDDIWANSKD